MQNGDTITTRECLVNKPYKYDIKETAVKAVFFLNYCKSITYIVYICNQIINIKPSIDNSIKKHKYLQSYGFEKIYTAVFCNCQH